MSSIATATSPLLEKGTAVQRASKTHRVYASVDVERHNKPNDMWSAWRSRFQWIQ